MAEGMTFWFLASYWPSFRPNRLPFGSIPAQAFSSFLQSTWQKYPPTPPWQKAPSVWRKACLPCWRVESSWTWWTRSRRRLPKRLVPAQWWPWNESPQISANPRVWHECQTPRWSRTCVFFLRRQWRYVETVWGSHKQESKKPCVFFFEDSYLGRAVDRRPWQFSI